MATKSADKMPLVSTRAAVNKVCIIYVCSASYPRSNLSRRTWHEKVTEVVLLYTNTLSVLIVPVTSGAAYDHVLEAVCSVPAVICKI